MPSKSMSELYNEVQEKQKQMAEQPEPVNHPPHYTQHPSGVECIEITRHMSFNLGNVVKYLWRFDSKGAALEDLKKARWYLEDQIAMMELGECPVQDR